MKIEGLAEHDARSVCKAAPLLLKKLVYNQFHTVNPKETIYDNL